MEKLCVSGLLPVFQEQCFSATPENADILHLDIKVQVAADQLGVFLLVLLVWVESPQLGDEDREIVLDERITVDEGLK